jgi:hypothetical protein
MTKGDYRLLRVELMSDIQIYVHQCKSACVPDLAMHAIPYWL